MLIFDSGVGGLSILKHIKKKLPNVNYIYILDNQAFPYGNKTSAFIIERSIKIINIIKKAYPIKLVVIACNTVSTTALSTLKKKFNIPIIGIFPAIDLADKKTKNNIIGLVATKNTINSYYTKKIVYQYSFNNTVQIIGTNKLASIAEKKVRGSKVSKKQLENIFKPWIQLRVQPDTIVLGCTHFVLLKKEIHTILYKKSSIYFLDSVEILVSEIKHCFKQLGHDQNVKKNIFFYSKNSKDLKKLLFFLTRYHFNDIQYINLN